MTFDPTLIASVDPGNLKEAPFIAYAGQPIPDGPASAQPCRIRGGHRQVLHWVQEEPSEPFVGAWCDDLSAHGRMALLARAHQAQAAA